MFVCLFVWLVWFGLVIIYNDAYDRTNVMASINVRQRIKVAQWARPGPHSQVSVPP